MEREGRANGQNKGQTMNVLFTMLLFLVFVLSALFSVLIGGKVYENIRGRMEESYTGSVALNYVANKVRQGDMDGGITVREVDRVPVLELRQEINDRAYITWIYYYDGYIRELFTNEGSGLGLADGLEIIECEGLGFGLDNRLLRVETTGKNGGSLMLYVRSGGQAGE
jgi:hypothetical protein